MSFSRPKFPGNPFDQLILMTVLGLAIAIAVIWGHSHQFPLKVADFSWSGEKIGVFDKYFTISFNRWVDRASIAQNLVIKPNLRGKISWRGNKLFYTLTELPIYATKYEVHIEDNNQALQPFIGMFQSHDRAFAYIGINGQERGKLILCNIITTGENLTELKKTILTPNDLIVTDFAIYPRGDKILFSAVEAVSNSENSLKQELYTVTTGLNQKTSAEVSRSGRVKRFLEATTYQNLKFDLSENGETVIVWRVNQNNSADASLWVITENGDARPLGIGGEQFKVAPDGKTLAIKQDRGIALIPLVEGAGSPQFLENFERILGFSEDSSQKLLVRKNNNISYSLYTVDSQGQAELLIHSRHPIIACQAEPRQRTNLYCLKTDLVLGQNNQLQEEPFLSIINLPKAQDIPLLALPNYRGVQMSMSPDGVALLFDQVVINPFAVNNNLITGSGERIADGSLWLLPLPETIDSQTPQNITPKELNSGFKPRWLP